MTIDVDCAYVKTLVPAFGEAGHPMSRYIGVNPGAGFSSAGGFLNKALSQALATQNTTNADCPEFNNVSHGHRAHSLFISLHS